MNSAGFPVPFASTNLYRAYFEHANLGFALTSPEKGWLHVNPRLCEMLGYSASDLEEMTWADLTHPDDLPADVAQFSRLLAGEIDAYELDKRFVRKDGGIVPTHLTVACERDETGKLEVVLATLTDLTRQQAVLDALKLSEQRFQLLADSTLDGLWDWDIRANTLWLSPSWKAQVGYRDVELANAFETWDGLIHPDDHSRVMQHLQAFLDEPVAVWQETFRLRHRLGDWRQVLARAIVVFGDDNKPARIFGVHVDITSERNALAELEAMNRDQERLLRERARELVASEVRYRNIADYTFDWETWIDASGELRYCSPSCERITGYVASAFVADPGLMERIVHPKDLHDWQVHMARVASERKTRTLAYRIQRSDGAERWVERFDHPMLSAQQEDIGTRGSTRDITDVRMARRALEREKTFVETVLNTAQAIILVLDTSARIVRVNPYIARLTGRSVDDLIDQNWIDTCLPEADRARIHEVFRRSIDEGRSNGHVNPIMAADGTLRDISWYDELIRAEDGSPQYVVAVGIDVTEQRRAEQALHEANEYLEEKVRQRSRELETAQAAMIQSEKLSSLGTLVAGLSHEINNPLMGAINYVEYVRDRSEPELARILDKADRELTRIGGIVGNLLRYARPNSANLIAVDLAAVNKRATDLLAAELRARGIQVTDRIPASLPRVQGDPGAFQQVFLNLLINARDAVTDSERREIEIRGGEASGEVWIEIADTGQGIPAKLQSAIYDPFFSTKPPGKGTGLGLPISLSIVDGLGGRLELRETGAGGTVFRMTLPAATADSD